MEMIQSDQFRQQFESSLSYQSTYSISLQTSTTAWKSHHSDLLGVEDYEYIEIVDVRMSWNASSYD